MIRARLLSSFLSAFLCFSAAAQRTQLASSGMVEVRAHFVAKNPRDRLPMQIHVELISQGISVGETFTDGRELTFVVRPGVYAFRISGFGIESETLSQFEVAPGDLAHYELVTVDVKNENPGDVSAGGTVSAADLRAPDKAIHEYDRGHEDFEQKKYSSAEKHFNRAVEIYPEYVSAWNDLGNVRAQQQNWEQAITAFQHAAQADPNYPSASFGIARCQYNAKKFAEGDATLTAMIKKRPTDVQVWAMLAQMQLSEGKVPEAIESVAKVHSLPHQHLAGVHIVGMQAFATEHDNQHAVEQARLYLAEDPKGPLAGTIRERLRQYEASQAPH
jgi:predicted Zn-dependent protease